ncbi:MAG TPA: MlaD family protein [bacterium]|nr:MlaD family protein [bacterium]HPO08705.1 MlaD family protein [bacterium]HQP99668.1 MlaD family protein [bacterium]
MRIFTNEVKVGLVIITTVFFFVVMVSTVGNFGKMWGTEKVLVRMDSAAGLKEYASVTFAGKKIGVVDKIEIQEIENRPWVVLSCSLHDPSHIVLDSTACVGQSSLLGESYLELSRGTSATRIADATQKPFMLQGVPAVTFDQVFAAVDRISLQVEDILQDIKRISGSENVQGGLRSTFLRLDRASQQVEQAAVTLRESVGSATEDIRYVLQQGRGIADDLRLASGKVRQGAEGFPALVSETRQRIQKLTTDLENLLARADQLVADSKPKLASALDDFSALAKQVRGDAEDLAQHLLTLTDNLNQVVDENQGDIRRLIDDLTVTAGHLASVARQLDEHPWRAVWKTDERLSPPEITPEWTPEIGKSEKR